MRILIVDTFYGPYLERLYGDGTLAMQTWAQQHKAHFAGGFGTGDAYSDGLRLLGVEAIEIVANSPILQETWTREHQPDLLRQIPNGQERLLAILEAQIRWWGPTVLYVQDINWLPATFVHHVRQIVEMVVGQNACPLAPSLDLRPYDLLLTSLPHYVSKFRATGVKSAYFPIGFDERLLKRHQTNGSRPHTLTFVGGLGGYHSQGTQMLEAISKELPLQVWGYGGRQLPIDSTLKKRWVGEAWAEEMYGLLAKSRITINRHINIAESYANNMRLYEATGMGACLLTDNKTNLPCIFEPDHEVVTYSSPAEAISKLKQLIKEPETASAIAARGQKRTLKEHTYRNRMVELVSLLKRHSRKHIGTHKQGRGTQSLVVACSAKNIRHIPAPIKQALHKEHKNHQLILISDANPQIPELKGIKRWCGSKILTDKSEAETLLDAIEPNQILFVDEETQDRDKEDWSVKLRRQADNLKIVCTSVRTSR